MGRKKQWIESEVIDGVVTIEISSWKYFNTYICDELIDYSGYIWRGQMNTDWDLEPTLDRILRSSGKIYDAHIRDRHLTNFKYATRGRRGVAPPALENDNDWWALGQHHGLATPLLDWTTSPFVAAFFAFEEESKDPINKRAIYAIFTSSIESTSKKIKAGFTGQGRPHIVELVRPFSDENSRLVNQSGLFTRAPDGMYLENWVRQNFKGNNKEFIMIKFLLPDSDRNLCLRSLNRMNINYLTLFPDLYGASKHSNINISINKY